VVSRKAGAKSIIDDAVSEFGTVDILINNAGILRDKTFKKLTLDDWDILIDVHLNGSAYVTHAAWPIMYEKRFGRIVFTSSTSGIYGNFGQANYAAAKMGLLGLANVLAIEGKPKNICVNCLAPSAATRLINTIPGRDLDLDNPEPEQHPKLVTPAVLFMSGENAPTGKIIQAGNGRFSVAAIFNNNDLELGVDVTYEDLLTKSDELLDMSSASEGWTYMKKYLKEMAEQKKNEQNN
jgi:NAD(P)-dependent dehydrogenase (short-subunit alcohol dehydrogenase family)